MNIEYNSAKTQRFVNTNVIKIWKYICKIVNACVTCVACFHLFITFRCLIKGYTRLFNFRNFDTLPSLIRVYPLIKFWKSVQPPHFFPTLCLPVFKKMSTLPVYQAHFYPTRLFDFQKYSPLPSYQGLPFYQAPKSMYDY